MSRLPRVLMVTGASLPELSGGGLQARALVAALRGRAEFVVLTTTTRDDTATEDAIDGTPVIRVRVDVSRPVSKVRAAFAMARTLWRLRDRFDVAHLHGFSQKAMLVVPLAHLLGKRAMLTLHTAGEDEPSAVRAAGRLAWACYRAIDLFVPISPLMAQRAALELPAKRLWSASNGIDVERFRPAADDERDALARAFGLDRTKQWILFVGFFSRDKGPHVLFEAWRRLRAEHRSATGLLYVGAAQSRYHEVDPGLAASIRAGAAELGLSEAVVFLDEIREVERCFRAADIFVFPSRREARGMVLVEAMACGLPSIASALPGATDHVEDGVTGLLVPPHDIAALTAALGRLLDDPACARRMGERARDAVAATFDIRHTATRMLDAYHMLAPSGDQS